MESQLPLEAYPPTGLKAYADEFGGETIRQLGDVPWRGCVPWPYNCRCLRSLGVPVAPFDDERNAELDHVYTVRPSAVANIRQAHIEIAEGLNRRSLRLPVRFRPAY